jgi:hypothetical protein
MMTDIFKASKTDGRLAALVNEAREHAQTYDLRRSGAKVTIKTVLRLCEEFKNVVDRMVRYGKEKVCLSGACEYDLDSCAGILENAFEKSGHGQMQKLRACSMR